MKNKRYTFFLVIGVFLLVIASFIIFSDYRKKDIDYSELEEIISDQVFEMGDSYYVYFQRAGCSYCDNVKEDIINFAKKERVYVLDTLRKENESLKDYDWASHEKEYNQEIGEMQNDEAVFYNGLAIDKLEKIYSPYEYTIQTRTDENDISKEKIYAILEVPVIDLSKESSKNLIVPAVPYMIYIENGVILQDYFGDTQILEFLGSTRKPLDDYLQLK